MTKIENFTRDEAKRDKLNEALPVVVEALEALKDSLEAGRINEGLGSPDVGNGYFQQIVGAKYLIDHLPELTKPVKKVASLAGRRQYTEADREELKRRQQKK
jgi:hypothetical protein